MLVSVVMVFSRTSLCAPSTPSLTTPNVFLWSPETSRAALGTLAEHWGERYPAIVPGWERNWERLTPFCDYPPEIRKVVYTTHAVESLNYRLRNIIKGRGAFPQDDAIRKLLYHGLKNVSKNGRCRSGTGRLR